MQSLSGEYRRCTLIVGVIDSRKKELQIRDIESIRHIVNLQALNAVSYMVRHIAHSNENGGIANRNGRLENRNLFNIIRSSDSLDFVGRGCLVNYLGGRTADAFGGVGGAFEHRWQLFAFNVGHGRKILEDILYRYSGFVEPTLIVRINDVLEDNFFVEKFQLGRSSQYYLEIAAQESRESLTCSGWGTLGLHYFNAVYINGRERSPNYEPFLTFLAKLWNLVEYASEGGRMDVFPAPIRNVREPSVDPTRGARTQGN
ncbi:MAG: hypothetical protein IOD03_16575 [Methylocystis sp.]|nr:hypothetical protein [Methylocystis sp.]